jgi:hypothetical protein
MGLKFCTLNFTQKILPTPRRPPAMLEMHIGHTIIGLVHFSWNLTMHSAAQWVWQSVACMLNDRHKFETGTSYIIFQCNCLSKSHDSSVSIVLGYGLDNQDSRVRFLAGAGNFSLHHHVQNGSGGYQASYPMGTRGSFPGVKAAWEWSWPLAFIYCRGQKMCGTVLPLPQYAFMAWCLVKHRDNFTFTFTCNCLSMWNT